MKGKQKKGRWRLFAICYGLALLVWLGLCGFHLLRDTLHQNDGTLLPRRLAPEDFDELSGIVFAEDWEEDAYFTTADSDSQMILLFPGGAPVGRFVFRARAVNKPGGEMALYYTTGPGQGFGEGQKLWPKQEADGAWVFDLDGRKVWGLRLDPDSVGGVYWQVESIVLNDPKAVWAYFVPDILQILVLLAAPLLAAAVVAEVMAFLQPLLARRRLERRWQQGGRHKPGGKPNKAAAEPGKSDGKG